jgi:hypothetical protein
MRVSRSGISRPESAIAPVTNRASPPQQGTSMITTSTSRTSLSRKIAESFSRYAAASSNLGQPIMTTRSARKRAWKSG